MDSKTTYPFRAPKKFTKKSLHGRARTATMIYKDMERAQKFYVNVFGWDMFKLPKDVLGRTPDESTPDICCATGPAGVSWECIVPGYLSCTLIKEESDTDKPYLMLEVEMDVSFQETLDKFVQKGGKIISRSNNTGAWAEVAMVEDPAGNRLMLWRCPDSRTWQEPETDYDKD
ncbi:MAG: VOC family protein [Defluviitaleaceae bacterium]|nr:VOC family protein [Defluviitaleaceae bacterium]